MTSPNRNGTDDVSLGLALALLAAATFTLLALGPIAIVGVVTPWVIVWATGRSSYALSVLLIGGTSVAALLVLGHLWPALVTGYALVTAPSDMIAQDWALLAFRPDVAPSALAVGLSIGSAARLTFQDKRSEAQGENDRESQPAPVARLRAKLGASPSAVFGDGSILGADMETGARVGLSDDDANHHVMICGATGTGKTVSSTNIIQSHIERKLPVIFLDGKGDVGLGRRLKAVAENLGRPAYIFHHHSDETDDACAYNPVSADDFTALANLITTLRPFTEPHYEVLQKGFMQAVTKVAKAIGEPLDLLTLGHLLSVNAMTAAIRRNRHRIANAQALITEIQEQRAAEEAGVESLTGIIKNLARSSLAPLFDTRSGSGRPVLTLPEARQAGAFVYFALPALIYPDLSKGLGQLIINDIRLTLASRRGPWLIVLDELSTYSGEQILSLINQGRGFGGRVIILGQSFADLETVDHVDGKAFRNQILGSINTLVIHRLNGPDDAELAAQIAGTYAKPEMTAQTVGNKPTGAGSVRITREFLVGPDRFKNLKRGEAVVLSKFGKPVRRIKARLPDFMK